MMKKIIALILLFAFVTFQAQNNQVWQAYFSYNSIKDVTLSNGKVFAVAENAVFSKDIATNEIKKYTTVEGLSGDAITQIHYSETHKKIIIGHATGLIIVINEKDNSVLNVVDIVNKQDILSNQKKINHFTEFNNKLYISTDYGISVFNLQNSEFGDSYFIGPQGSKVAVFQTTVFNNTIYAIVNSYGLLTASVNNPFLIDYNQWTIARAGYWKAIEAMQNKLALLDNAGTLYELTSANTLVTVATFPLIPLDFKYKNGELVVTNQSEVHVFDENLIRINQISNAFQPLVQFTSAVTNSDKLYIGTNEDGLLEFSKTNTSSYLKISPDGPIRNKVFGLKANTLGFWAVYGEYNSDLNPLRNSYGISRFKNSQWNHIPFSNLFGAQSLISIVNHPQNEEDVYFSSFCSGLLRLKNEVPQVLYNDSNSSMQLIPNYPIRDFRIGVSNFDKSNNLWTTTAFATNQLHVFRANGTWQSL